MHAHPHIVPTPVKVVHQQLEEIKEELKSRLAVLAGAGDARSKARLLAQNDPDGTAIKRQQRRLDKIDSERLEGGGVFGGQLNVGDIPPGQAVLSELLAECYSLVSDYQNAVESIPR